MISWKSIHRQAATLIIVFATALPATAEVAVSISASPAAAGQSTTASIELQQASGLAGAELVVQMPEFIVAGPVQVLPALAEFQVVSRAQPGRIAIALANAEGLKQTGGTVLEVPLHIAPDAPPGDYPLSFARVMLCDSQPAVLASASLPGTLRIQPPPPDSDQDGLPDLWETEHFGTTSGSATTDSDRDGLSDYQEFLAGTDPSSPDSTFRVRAARGTTPLGGGNVLLQWEGVEGHQYQIQWSDGPLGPGMTWHTVYNPEFERSNSTWSWTDDGTRTHARPEASLERYYRVLVTK